MKLYTDKELTDSVDSGRGAPTKYVEEAAELRANPGVWGEMEDFQKNTGANIRAGLLASFRPKGAWEAKTRGGRLFVRYIGESK